MSVARERKKLKIDSLFKNYYLKVFFILGTSTKKQKVPRSIGKCHWCSRNGVFCLWGQRRCQPVNEQIKVKLITCFHNFWIYDFFSSNFLCFVFYNAHCSGQPLFFPVPFFNKFSESDFCAFSFFRENATD